LLIADDTDTGQWEAGSFEVEVVTAALEVVKADCTVFEMFGVTLPCFDLEPVFCSDFGFGLALGEGLALGFDFTVGLIGNFTGSFGMAAAPSNGENTLGNVGVFIIDATVEVDAADKGAETFDIECTVVNDDDDDDEKAELILPTTGTLELRLVFVTAGALFFEDKLSR
jgi:hypothetical protein